MQTFRDHSIPLRLARAKPLCHEPFGSTQISYGPYSTFRLGQSGDALYTRSVGRRTFKKSLRTACLLLICAVIPATAQTSDQEVGKFITEKLAAWQHRLKLDEWTISVSMNRRTELKPKTLGGIKWDKKKRTAAIAVLDPSEYQLPFNEMLADLEFTIVHELVHLELASLPRSEASRTNEEHAVNQIAEALLTLERQK